MDKFLVMPGNEQQTLWARRLSAVASAVMGRCNKFANGERLRSDAGDHNTLTVFLEKETLAIANSITDYN